MLHVCAFMSGLQACKAQFSYSLEPTPVTDTKATPRCVFVIHVCMHDLEAQGESRTQEEVLRSIR